MANIKLSAQRWVKKEENLKREFLMLMVRRGIYFSNDQSTFRKREVFQVISEVIPPAPHYIILKDFMGKIEAHFYFTEDQFEKLKQDYRIFKFNQKNKTQKKVKIQAYINKETHDKLESIKSEFGYKTIDRCLKCLIDQNTSYTKKLKERVESLNKNLKELETLKAKIEQYNSDLVAEINVLNERSKGLKKSIAQYHEKKFFEKLEYHLQSAMRELVSSDQFKITDVETLTKLIMEQLRPEVLQDIKMKGFIDQDESGIT